MMKTHVQFFNTTPHMGGFILGIDAATEEHEGMKAKRSGQRFEDRAYGTVCRCRRYTVRRIVPDHFRFIAAYMGQEGNTDRGARLSCSVLSLPIITSRTFSAGIGYREGSKTDHFRKEQTGRFDSRGNVAWNHRSRRIDQRR